MSASGARRVWLAYGIAIVATLLLDLAWICLPGRWGNRVPFSLFISVVGAAALAGGRGPGMLAALVGALSGLYLGEPRFGQRADWLNFGIFVVTSFFVAVGGARLRRAFRELERSKREAEIRAREEAARLNARLAELLESERAARQTAERATRLKDDLVATVSHELRTPLNAIIGWADLLQRAGENPQKLGRGLAAIARNGQALAQIVGDLTDASRMDAGKLHLDMAVHDLSQLAETAVDALRPVAAARHVEIRTALDAVDVLGDPARVQQVIWNLVSNAVKFTPAGGLVTISTARDEDGRGVLRVRDTGEGIAPEMLPHVFERFRQADASTTRRHGGLGLGLSISRQIVELHGGTLRAESGGLGLGAELTTTFPAASEERRSETRAVLRRDPHVLGGKRILVVDDDPDAREVSKRVLEEHGACVVVAASAPEALEILAGGGVSVLVSDISMPGMDGYELLRRVRGDSGAGPPAVAVTAHTRPEDRARARAAGFTDHLAKPLDAASLVAAVRAASRSSGAGAANGRAAGGPGG